MSKLLTTVLALGITAAPALAQEHKHSDSDVGSVSFATGCNAQAQARMNRAVAMLHSFWFTEARSTFESAATADPTCGVAYWGVALTHFGNPFAGGPAAAGNAAGLAAAQKAASMGAKTPRDQGYIDAALALYGDYDKVDNRTRMQRYEQAMAKLHAADANDMESAIFHGIWLVATASPTDMTFAQQKRAAELLNPLFVQHPQHPGLAHYIIHAFDSPPMAKFALDAARKYADIAPAAPHALHMPSHTFTRLGYWDESIKTNRRSADLEPTRGAKAHASDYMVYAYLQQGRDEQARSVLGEIGIDPADTDPTGIQGLGGYNAIAMPARFALERDDWGMAAQLPVLSDQPAFVQAITRFARALGNARTGKAAEARAEINELKKLTDALTAAKDPYWPIVVDAQRMAAEAWVLHLEGQHGAAIETARMAADKEDLVEKHPVTPGPLIPARELYGDILFAHGKAEEALAQYRKTLEREPNRLRTLRGAARAAGKSGETEASRQYYSDMLKLLAPDSKRAELVEAKRAVGGA